MGQLLKGVPRPRFGPLYIGGGKPTKQAESQWDSDSSLWSARPMWANGWCGRPMWLMHPLGPCGPHTLGGPHFYTPLEPSKRFRYPAEIFRNFFDTSGNHFPYMNLILRTSPELLVRSMISSGTPNHHSFISSFILSQNLISSER